MKASPLVWCSLNASLMIAVSIHRSECSWAATVFIVFSHSSDRKKHEQGKRFTREKNTKSMDNCICFSWCTVSCARSCCARSLPPSHKKRSCVHFSKHLSSYQASFPSYPGPQDADVWTSSLDTGQLVPLSLQHTERCPSSAILQRKQTAFNLWIASVADQGGLVNHNIFQTLRFSYQKQFAFDFSHGHCHADFSSRNRSLKKWWSLLEEHRTFLRTRM